MCWQVLTLSNDTMLTLWFYQKAAHPSFELSDELGVLIFRLLQHILEGANVLVEEFFDLVHAKRVALVRVNFLCNR